ncbi:hypothetical protein CLTEP_27900 [Clostridium tepidiprofundi DSM 19306]|uniref:Uncharacterized protein n=1 Tax=Clostridium tepidiprofundi DSM 19306 TaxID=1121338 RepID=A0A151AHR2_9CLOT|nr:hypothetical protein [Clostridium tepidiprofundi]KYH27163.1 hypothetical protein CLTEP_27900 [Clostridium tepidiprofundi DSM 19306]
MRFLTKFEVHVVWYYGEIPRSVKTQIWKQAGYSSSQSVVQNAKDMNETLISQRLQNAIENVIGNEKWNQFLKRALIKVEKLTITTENDYFRKLKYEFEKFTKEAENIFTVDGSTDDKIIERLKNAKDLLNKIDLNNITVDDGNTYIRILKSILN